MLTSDDKLHKRE